MRSAFRAMVSRMPAGAGGRRYNFQAGSATSSIPAKSRLGQLPPVGAMTKAIAILAEAPVASDISSVAITIRWSAGRTLLSHSSVLPKAYLALLGRGLPPLL